MSTVMSPGSLEKTLPSSYYHSPEMFERERKSIFHHEWFCAAREEELPANGSLMVIDILGESVLVVRTNEGKLRAHYNVCRHRGARLCAEDGKWNVQLRGKHMKQARLRCPYHQWTYSLEGSLLAAPFLSDAAGFSKEEFSLYPVGLETWGGFIFLNLSPREAAAQSRTLLSQLAGTVEKFKRYPLPELRTARTLCYEVAANWKVIMENYNECYHCGPVHPELCQIVPDFKRAGGSGLDWVRGIPHRPGAYTFTTTGTTSRAAFPGLNEDERERHTAELIYPNLLLSLSCDHVAAFLLWPQGPERTRVECRFLFHPQEIVKDSFDPADAVDFWDLVNRQDWAVCERVQAGLKSRVHEFGYYAPMEDQAADIRRYVQARLKPLPARTADRDG